MRIISFLTCNLFSVSRANNQANTGYQTLTDSQSANTPTFTKNDVQGKNNTQLAQLFFTTPQLTQESKALIAGAFARNIQAEVTSIPDATVSGQIQALTQTLKTEYDNAPPSANNETQFKLNELSNISSLLKTTAEQTHETKPLQKLTGYIKRNEYKINRYMMLAGCGIGAVGTAVAGAVAGTFAGGVTLGALGGMLGFVAGGYGGALVGGLLTEVLVGVSNLTRKFVKDKATEETQNAAQNAFKTQFGTIKQNLEAQALTEKQARETAQLQNRHEVVMEMQPVLA